MGPIRCHGNHSFDPFHPIFYSKFCPDKTMPHVKFDGSGFIGLRIFSLFVVDFFSTDMTFFTEIQIPYFYIVIGVGIIFFL